MEEGFVPSPTGKVEDLLVVSDDPKALVDQLCVKWEEFQTNR